MAIPTTLPNKENDALSIGLKPSEIKVLSWRNIELFQPKGFKIGSTEGIWKSIVNNELLDKFKVFQMPGSKKYFMFDGHTRKTLMLEKEEDGIAKFPDTMECEIFQFKTKQEAAKALLEYQAGKLKISEQGLIEFAESVQADQGEFIKIADDFELGIVRDTQINENLNKEINIDSIETGFVIKLNYTEDEFTFVKQELSKIAKTPEAAVFKLVSKK